MILIFLKNDLLINMCVHCSTKVFASDGSQKIEEKEMPFDGSVRS